MNPPIDIASIESLAPVRFDQLSEESLTDYFKNTWELYEMLFSSIENDAILYNNPDPLRHPLIFYLGHTAVFYINKLVIAGMLKQEERINPYFELIFEQGVDPAKADELGAEVWPSVDEVRKYRDDAYQLILDFIASIDCSLKVTESHPLWSIFMGLEHDRIHFETSSVLIRQYPQDLVNKPAAWDYAPTQFVAEDNEWITVPRSEIQLGKPDDCPIFGWDNEYGSLSVDVKGFEASCNLITNAEFKDFVNAHGYKTKDFWSKEGWEWLTKLDVKHPKFWMKKADTFTYRAMFDELEMPESWPVEVNCHEALAFCAWKGNGTRLLTEAEFQAIAQTARYQPFDLFNGGHFNINLKYGSPTPVGMLKEASSTLGFNDVWGNVWNWLSDDFYPLPGYKIHDYYTDFSQPYMDSDHATLLGGSWASSGTSASKYYRLWFRRHFYQHAGFRIARDLNA